MNKKELGPLWLERINQFYKSGLSMKKWSVQQGIPVGQLQYWIQKSKNEITNNNTSSTRFVPVILNEEIKEVNNIKIVNTQPLKVTIGKCVIDVQKGFDSTLLKEVIEVLIKVC